MVCVSLSTDLGLMHVSEGFSIERPPAVFEAGFKLEQRVPAHPLAHARGSCSSPGAHELPADPGCSCTGPELRASRTARSLSPEHLGAALPTPQIYPVRGCELFPQLISSLAQQPAKVQTAAAGAGARFTASSPCSEILDAKIEPFVCTTSSWILSNVSSNQGAGKEVKKNNRNILYSRKKERTPTLLGEGFSWEVTSTSFPQPCCCQISGCHHAYLCCRAGGTPQAEAPCSTHLSPGLSGL